MGYASAMRGLPFEWGKTDCASIVRAGLELTYEKDLFDGKIKPWTSLKTAASRWKSIDLENLLLSLGAQEVSPQHTQAGDLAIGPELDENQLPQLALVLPVSKVLISTPEYGVQIIHVSDLLPGTRYWRL